MKPKIFVIGDCMDDWYWCGSATRLSPEAPIPVVKIDTGPVLLAGGAGNVVENLRSLGAEVTATFGAGRPKKHRLLVEDTQVARWDEDDSCCPIQKWSVIENPADIVVVSDYGKGSVPDWLPEVLRGRTVFVDTKRDPLMWQDVATVVFPNQKEWYRFERSYRRIRATVILKLGKNGMEMRWLGRVQHALYSKVRRVRCANGAGDTVIAACAYWWAMMRDRGPVDMLAYASAAAAVVVEKPLTATVTQAEIREILRR